MLIFVFDLWGRKHCGKGRNYWSLALSPLSTMFSKKVSPLRHFKDLIVWYTVERLLKCRQKVKVYTAVLT